MKYFNYSLTTVLLFLFFSKFVYADYKTYVGVQGGFIYSDNEGNADKTAQELANASGRAVTYSYEELTWGIRPYGGFNVNDKVSIEVGYISVSYTHLTLPTMFEV